MVRRQEPAKVTDINVERQLKNWRNQSESGDAVAPLLAVRMCILLDLPVSGWAGEAFSDSVSRIAEGSVSSWEEVFGEFPHAEKQSRARTEELKVWSMVNRLKTKKPKPRDIYGCVAAEFGISRADTKRFYKEGEKLLDKAIDAMALDDKGA